MTDTVMQTWSRMNRAIKAAEKDGFDVFVYSEHIMLKYKKIY